MEKPNKKMDKPTKAALITLVSAIALSWLYYLVLTPYMSTLNFKTEPKYELELPNYFEPKEKDHE